MPETIAKEARDASKQFAKAPKGVRRRYAAVARILQDSRTFLWRIRQQTSDPDEQHGQLFAVVGSAIHYACDLCGWSEQEFRRCVDKTFEARAKAEAEAKADA